MPKVAPHVLPRAGFVEKVRVRESSSCRMSGGSSMTALYPVWSAEVPRSLWLVDAMTGAGEKTPDGALADGDGRPAANGPISAPGWLRALLERLRLAPRSRGEVIYHGFISYSHAADARLGPALQKGLQRFAKPWYSTRALHVFRDDSSLSANPRLWQSITLALDGSEHLILLASRRAASSEWVGREAAYWCEHKDPAKILICLTDGRLAWNESGRASAAEGDALPPALAGAFTEEPRYIDLRWAREAGDLSLKHPRWRDAVAEIAAPLHHVAKDELSGEEVRQHRRTLRVARAAAGSLLALAVAAVVLGLIAYSQYHSAQARALAAEATAALQTNPEQALSLAVHSTEVNASKNGVAALRSALAQAPQRVTIQSHGGANVQAQWNPSGAQIAVSGPGSKVELWSTLGRVERVLVGAEGSSPITQLAYSRNGVWLAAVTRAGSVEAWDVRTGRAVPTQRLDAEIGAAATSKAGSDTLHTSIVWGTAKPEDLLVYGSGFDQALSLDARSAAVTSLLTLPAGTGGIEALAPSPDGSKVFVIVDSRNVTTVGSATGYAVNLDRRGTSTMSSRMFGDLGCWTGDSKDVVTWNPNEAEDLNLRWWNASTGKEINHFPAELTLTAGACGQGQTDTWAASGSRDGVLTLHLSVGVNYQLPAFRRFITQIASSHDGDYLAAADADGTARVFAANTGTEIRTLNDGDAVTSVSFSPDDGLVLTTDQRGLVRIWDSGVGEPVSKLQLSSAGHTYPMGFTDGDRLVFGINASVKEDGQTGNGWVSRVRIGEVSAVLWSAATGRLTADIPLPGVTSLSQAAIGSCTTLESDTIPCAVVPPATLAQPAPSAYYSSAGLLGIAVSRTGREIAYPTANGVRIIDNSGRVLGTLALPDPATGLTFSARELIVMTDHAVYLRPLRTGGGTVILRQRQRPLDVEVSADGRRLVVATFDGPVTVWETATGAQLASFKVTRAFSSRVDQLVGASGRLGLKPPSPVRVAINSDGSEVAAGSSWQTVFLWDVAERRLVSERFVSAPVDQGLAASGSTSAGSMNGPWVIDQLAFALGGSRLLATDLPFYLAGDTEAPTTAEVISAHGDRVSFYQSTDISEGAIDPGDALSPNGSFLLAGTMDLGLDSAAAANAVYDAATGEQLLGLGSADRVVFSPQEWPSPTQPWAANGIDLIAGHGIYACDACGSLHAMQASARHRLAWLRPLSVGDDNPPTANPYQ